MLKKLQSGQNEKERHLFNHKITQFFFFFFTLDKTFSTEARVEDITGTLLANKDFQISITVGEWVKNS